MGLWACPPGRHPQKSRTPRPGRLRWGVTTHRLPYAARLSARKVSDTNRITFKLFPRCFGGRSQCDPSLESWAPEAGLGAAGTADAVTPAAVSAAAFFEKISPCGFLAHDDLLIGI